MFTQVLTHQSVAARIGAGWHACIAELDAMLGARPDADADDDDWMPLYEGYIDQVGPELGTPGTDGSMTWERATHVEPERVRAATSEPTELGAWGAAGASDQGVRWDIGPAEHGTLYRLTVDGAGSDPELAATWHALLLQLDMWMAAEQLVPISADRFLGQYEALLR